MAVRTAEREEFLADIITGAVEGGTGYWAAVQEYKWEGRDAKDRCAVLVEEDKLGDVAAFAELFRTSKGRRIKLSELLDEADGIYRLDIEAVARGIGRIKRGEIELNAGLKALILAGDAENDAGNIDADGVDVITQAALLGEIVYG